MGTGNDPLSTANRICAAHKRALDHETFYCLARAMMQECFNAMGLTLAEWRRETRKLDPYAPKPRIAPEVRRAKRKASIVRAIEAEVSNRATGEGTDKMNPDTRPTSEVLPTD